MNSSMYNLFPTPVAKIHNWREPTRREWDFFTYIQSQERAKNIGNTHTKDNHILNAPDMINLKEDLTSAINTYFQEVWKPKFDVEVYITISWINYTETGQYHHPHYHPNSVISGVYYIDTDDSDRITFYNPQPIWLTMNVEPKEWNIWNSQEWYVTIPKNSLVLFPSKLYHSVSPTINPKTRVSLSFNTFLKGKLDTELSEIIL